MSIDVYSSYPKSPPPKIKADEWQSEAKAESEPECKRARLELKDIDDAEESEVSSVSAFCPGSDSDWEDCDRSELEPEVESERDSRTPPWELKGFDDLELSDFAMYDDDPLPIAFRTNNGLYKNQAMIDEEKAFDEYLEKVGVESPWDATAPPHFLQLVGGIRPYDIREQDRPRFIHYCNLSLNKYNAENQGANFVFYELVKATSLVSCPLYYITFMAKDASNNNNNSTGASTFQAEVSDKLVPNGVGPDIVLCLKKPN